MSRGPKYPEGMREAADYLRRAVPLMMQHGIPPTPHNYALWYDYVKGQDNALNSALDSVVESQGTCPPDKSEELFLKFIVGDDIQQQERSREAVSSLVADIGHNIRQSVRHTQRFREEVNQHLSALETTQDTEAVTEVLQALENSTAHLFENQTRVEGKLENAQQQIENLRNELERTQKAAFIDGLTQLLNRQAFDKRLKQILQAPPAALSLLMVDVDHFKQFNDRYGHLTGDRVLRAVASAIREVAPTTAICARFGGEEFAVILPGAGHADALACAEAVRARVEALQIRLRDSGVVLDSITASCGAATHTAGEGMDELVERADTALYCAKNSGRNRVVAAP